MRRTLVAASLLLAVLPQLAWADALSDGISLVNKGEFENAIPLLEQAAQADPANPAPHQYLQQAYEGLMEPSKALSEHETMLELRFKLTRPKPDAKPKVDDLVLPPIYVRPGPGPALPAVTNDVIPRSAPTEFKATPIDTPAAKTAGSDSAAAPAGKTAPAPAPTPTPTPEASAPPPNLDPVGETGIHAPVIQPPTIQPPSIPQ